jgi:probable HAF family extracellular repeat protein
MTSPASTPTRSLEDPGLAAALPLAALLVGAGPATAQAAEPPPVSCITDNPVDPLGPGFLLDRGEFTTIDHPDAVLETAPYGINNRGQIVGGYDTAGFAVHGFVLDRGRYTTIDVPGAPTQALGLNDRGQILGTYIDAGGAFHGFLLDKGVYTTIDVPGALPSTAADSNARGQTIGFYLDAAGTTRVVLRAANGSLTTLAFPGAVATVPFGINNRGHLVGFSLDANQVRHGFLFHNGAYTTIDHPLASSDSQAHDLNDRGQIVGLYERAAGQTAQAREGASRSRSGPTPTEDIGSGPSPLTTWGTASGAASLQ